jgi:hypothetical protein
VRISIRIAQRETDKRNQGKKDRDDLEPFADKDDGPDRKPDAEDGDDKENDFAPAAVHEFIHRPESYYESVAKAMSNSTEDFRLWDMGYGIWDMGYEKYAKKRLKIQPLDFILDAIPNTRCHAVI